MSFSLVDVGGSPILLGIVGDVSESLRLREELDLKNRILEDGELELKEANQRLSEDSEKMREMNERLRELQSVKDNFLSSVSHELRTPLTSIRSFSEILLENEDAEDEVKREFISIINKESERLTRLVNDVLDLAKIEAGQMRFETEPVDFNMLSREVVRALAPLAQENGITVESRLPPELPPVLGDRDRLHQVLTNLLSNALKFSHRDTVVVLSGRANDEAMVEFCIEDRGPGIPKEELARIFDKFRQVGDTLTEKPAGTGLGLAICREIITLHGGRVWVQSKTGQGSKFFFTVRVATEPAAAPKKKMSIADKVRAAAEKARRGEPSELDLEFLEAEKPAPAAPEEATPAKPAEPKRELVEATAEIAPPGEKPAAESPDLGKLLPPLAQAEGEGGKRRGLPPMLDRS
jgi:signal transduction histidine kinase